MIIGLLFVLAAGALGFSLARKLVPEEQIAYAMPFGIATSTIIVFLVSLAIGFSGQSVLLSAILCALLALGLWKKKGGFKTSPISKRLVPLALFSLAFLFAINYAMFHFDQGALKGFPTDFGFHKSIIASLGNGNFPPENPLFAGHPLAYYYFLHLFTASFIMGGFSLQWAFIIVNSLVIFSVVLLLAMLAKTLFPKEAREGNTIVYLAVLLVLLNGTLAFVQAAKVGTFSFSQNFFNDPSLTHPFLTLLTAHLLVTPFAIGLALLLILAIKLIEGDFRFAALLGIMPLFHFFTFIVGVVLTAAYYAFNRSEKKTDYWPFAVGILLSLPQVAYYYFARGPAEIVFRLGWLSPSQDLVSIAWFWLQNLGIYILLGAIGYYYADEKARRLLLATLPWFILGNIFLFTPFHWDNVKLFLFFFVALAMLSAFALTKMIKKYGVPIVLVFLLLATSGGILSAATIVFSYNTNIYDSFDVKACDWAKANTPANALFLTDGQHTCMFGLTGKRVFLGDLQWITTHGLNYTQQLDENNRMLAGDCNLLKKNKIGYIYLDGYGSRHSYTNETFLQEKTIAVYNQNSRTIYKVNC